MRRPILVAAMLAAGVGGIAVMSSRVQLGGDTAVRSQSAPNAPAVPAISDPYVVRSDLVNPTNTLIVGGTSFQRRVEETQHEFAACMRAAGFDVRDEPTLPDPNPTTVAELVAFRLAHGYGLADRERTAAHPGPEVEHNLQLRATMDQATARKYAAAAGTEPEAGGGPLSGEGTGCTGQAHRAIETRYPQHRAAAAAVTQAADRKATRTQAAIDSWAKCVASQGVAVVASQGIGGVETALAAQLVPAPGGGPVGQVDLDEFRTRELRAARVDVECWATHFHPVLIEVATEAFAEARVHADGRTDADIKADAAGIRP